MAIVYRHIRKDKNEPFYIGIGKFESRAYETKGRTVAWKNIAKKGYEIEILFDNLNWEEACEKEKEFIALYGRKDIDTGILINMTEGGEGTIGYKHTKNAKEKCRLSSLGSNNVWYGKKRPEHSEKMKLIMTGLRIGEKNPLFGKPGYWKGKTTSVAKKIVYDGIEFESQTALAKYLNKSKAYITKLIKQNKL